MQIVSKNCEKCNSEHSVWWKITETGFLCNPCYKKQWNLDHIYPLSLLDLTAPEDFKKACHYTNLQPMWFIDNIKKGNKIE